LAKEKRLLFPLFFKCSERFFSKSSCHAPFMCAILSTPDLAMLVDVAVCAALPNLAFIASSAEATIL
jgi:hypothetical protein